MNLPKCHSYLCYVFVLIIIMIMGAIGLNTSTLDYAKSFIEIDPIDDTSKFFPHEEFSVLENHGNMTRTPRGIDRPKTIAYYANWAQTRPDPYNYLPENMVSIIPRIDYLYYAHARFDSSGNIFPIGQNECALGQWPQCRGSDDLGTTMYYRIVQIRKRHNPDMKILISLGGWAWGGELTCPYFSQMAASEISRSNFISQAIKFARTFEFDGIDLDWEYPAYSGCGGRTDDTQNLALLLKEFQSALIAEANSKGLPRLLISIPSPASTRNIQNMGFENIHPYVDHISIMSYDYHGSWDSIKGFNSPMNEQIDGNQLSIKITVEKLLSLVPASKLFLGMATYGRSFTVSGSCQPLSPGDAGGSRPYTGANGIISHYEIRSILSDPASRRMWDEKTQSPYICNQEQNLWISYDDEISLKIRADYLKSKQLGGVMFWSLDMDDFRFGYPLISSITDYINS